MKPHFNSAPRPFGFGPEHEGEGPGPGGRGPGGPAGRGGRGGPGEHGGRSEHRGPGEHGGSGEHGGPGHRGGKGGRSPGGPGFGPGFAAAFGRGFGPRGRGRGGAPEAPDASDAGGWFTGRLPGDWFAEAPTVVVDRDEILIVGELPPLDAAAGELDAAATAAAEAGRISRFREETREQRIEIARQGQHRYGREISWGASLGGTQELFTTASVPVMTRLRQQERQILDTLIDSGVARSRSDAVVWAIRLVGEHAQEWLGDLQSAMEEVNRLRSEGPDLG